MLELMYAWRLHVHDQTLVYAKTSKWLDQQPYLLLLSNKNKSEKEKKVGQKLDVAAPFRIIILITMH